MRKIVRSKELGYDYLDMSNTISFGSLHRLQRYSEYMHYEVNGDGHTDF